MATSVYTTNIRPLFSVIGSLLLINSEAKTPNSHGLYYKYIHIIYIHIYLLTEHQNVATISRGDGGSQAIIILAFTSYNYKH